LGGRKSLPDQADKDQGKGDRYRLTDYSAVIRKGVRVQRRAVPSLPSAEHAVQINKDDASLEKYCRRRRERRIFHPLRGRA
jgi:hypothetical protein